MTQTSPVSEEKRKNELFWEQDKIERRRKNISLYITTIPSEYQNIQSINKYYIEISEITINYIAAENNTIHN